MIPFCPMKTLPSGEAYKKGDVLVLFGELFNRGYANGIVEEAQKAGMTIVRATVGRRERDGSLRTLNSDEVNAIEKPFINIPLEAGFDLEPSAHGRTPIDQVKSLKLSDWQNAEIDWEEFQDSQKRGTERFRKHTENFLQELEAHIPEGANVLFVHTMAGGIPRAKIYMPLMNRIFKGQGERHLSSELFWNSPMGQFCAQSFQEVTAETLHHLIDLSTSLREKIAKSGGRTSYVAYGYHGTEIFFEDRFQWQTYTPYLQGWAKCRLEEIATEYSSQGVHCAVFNCPEILTNSSSIFLGVEVSLYPLVRALRQRFSERPDLEQTVLKCQDLLVEGTSVDQILEMVDGYLTHPLTRTFNDFEKWPMHNSPEQMDLMLKASESLIAQHKHPRELMTTTLSEPVIKACGKLMLAEGWEPRSPVLWLGHDIIAQSL